MKDSYFLVKFGEKQNIESLLMGQIYMRPIKIYREIENTEIGDIYEGYSYWANPEISSFSLDSHNEPPRVCRRPDLVRG